MAAFTERFDSPLHEISISYPSGWQVRPATATWDDRFVPSFHSPTGDVISDPTLGRNLYLVLTSTETDMTVDEWHGLVGWPVLCSDSEGADGAPDHESYALDTVHGYVFMSSCTNGGAKRYGAEVATGSRAFLVYLFVGSEADQASYDVDWFKAFLETVVLPAQATEAL